MNVCMFPSLWSAQSKTMSTSSRFPWKNSWQLRRRRFQKWLSEARLWSRGEEGHHKEDQPQAPVTTCVVLWLGQPAPDFQVVPWKPFATDIKVLSKWLLVFEQPSSIQSGNASRAIQLCSMLAEQIKSLQVTRPFDLMMTMENTWKPANINRTSKWQIMADHSLRRTFSQHLWLRRDKSSCRWRYGETLLEQCDRVLFEQQ